MGIHTKYDANPTSSFRKVIVILTLTKISVLNNRNFCCSIYLLL